MVTKPAKKKVVLLETFSRNSPGSMNRYASLISQAFENDPDLQIIRETVAPSVQPPSFLPSFLKTLIHHSGCWLNVSKIVARHRSSVFHLVDGSHGYLGHRLADQKLIATVHDVIPALQTEGFFPVARPSRGARFIINSSLTGLRKAKSLIFDSACSQNDYARLSGQQASDGFIVFPPLEPHFTNRNALAGDTAVKSSLEEHIPFILHLGNNGFYKNRIGAVEIFAQVAERIKHNLILAGPPISHSVEKRIAELGLKERIILEQNPSDERVRALYQKASLLIFPSLYEGFGWPPLEAMACGCPVICSNAGSLPEVVKQAAVVSDPADVGRFAAEVEKLLNSPELSHEMRNKGKVHISDFTLQRFAAQLTGVYKEVAGDA